MHPSDSLYFSPTKIYRLKSVLAPKTLAKMFSKLAKHAGKQRFFSRTNKTLYMSFESWYQVTLYLYLLFQSECFLS